MKPKSRPVGRVAQIVREGLKIGPTVSLRKAGTGERKARSTESKPQRKGGEDTTMKPEKPKRIRTEKTVFLGKDNLDDVGHVFDGMTVKDVIFLLGTLDPDSRFSHVFGWDYNKLTIVQEKVEPDSSYKLRLKEYELQLQRWKEHRREELKKELDELE